MIDGVELCRRIKRDEATANIPVLLMSGASRSDSDVIEGLKAGADDYLEIPFRHEEFLVKVARLSERRRMDQALKDSEERYRALANGYAELFENANDIIYTHDLKGNFTSLNKVGELVTSQDHNGVYRGLALSGTGMTDLKKFIFGMQEPIGTVMQVPRSRLQPFEKEDPSQSAVRIVKATENE